MRAFVRASPPPVLTQARSIPWVRGREQHYVAGAWITAARGAVRSVV